MQSLFATTARQLRRIDSASSSPIHSHLSESIQGINTIRAFKQQERFHLIQQERLDEHYTCQVSMMMTRKWVVHKLILYILFLPRKTITKLSNLIIAFYFSYNSIGPKKINGRYTCMKIVKHRKCFQYFITANFTFWWMMVFTCIM